MKPSDLRKQAEQMIQKGEMPSLEGVLKAVGEIRDEYKPKIIAARRQGEVQEKGTKALG